MWRGQRLTKQVNLYSVILSAACVGFCEVREVEGIAMGFASASWKEQRPSKKGVLPALEQGRVGEFGGCGSTGRGQ